MKRNFLLIFCLLFSYCSFCQKTIWHEVQIDSFLTVSLPGVIVITDTSIVKDGDQIETKNYKVTTPSSVIAVSIVQTDLNINPYKLNSSDKEAYEVIKNGFTKSAVQRGYGIDIKDTMVNNISGFKADLYTDDTKTVLEKITYNFFINSLSYSFVVAPIENRIAEANENVIELLGSIRFNKEKILSNDRGDQETSSFFENGQKVGEATGGLLVAGVIIFLVYKRSKQKKRTPVQ